MKNIVMEPCCSNSGDSGFSSPGTSVVGGISVVVAGGIVVTFLTSPVFVAFSLLKKDTRSCQTPTKAAETEWHEEISDPYKQNNRYTSQIIYPKEKFVLDESTLGFTLWHHKTLAQATTRKNDRLHESFFIIGGKRTPIIMIYPNFFHGLIEGRQHCGKIQVPVAHAYFCARNR